MNKEDINLKSYCILIYLFQYVSYICYSFYKSLGTLAMRKLPYYRYIINSVISWMIMDCRNIFL